MLTLRQLFVALAGTIVLMAAVPALGLAAAPIVREHFNFTSDPYDDNWCGIDGTGVDRVVVQYSEDASGASIENVNVTIVFTATSSGKSMEVHIARVGKTTARVDNGDGTVTIFATNDGVQSFKLPNGPMLVRDAGSITFAVTLDAATGDFISFEVVEEHGQFPPGCDQIVAALT